MGVPTGSCRVQRGDWLVRSPDQSEPHRPQVAATGGAAAVPTELCPLLQAECNPLLRRQAAEHVQLRPQRNCARRQAECNPLRRRQAAELVQLRPQQRRPSNSRCGAMGNYNYFPHFPNISHACMMLLAHLITAMLSEVLDVTSSSWKVLGHGGGRLSQSRVLHTQSQSCLYAPSTQPYLL